ncbi:NifU family protein [Parafannyhessea umbonata]|jgi:Fe-S cluster biogenesis protein NfuA|uniref:NifU family protein n=1 Tax=Parafannyhessea umbonata TaxID=604330 RepID=UPI001E33D312|nr:NifU family protein [Parafannyhessea umbonata]MCI6681025.1 NifU family protein [Parafannyhessea umbonata]MDD6565657.1 NifU family protein [Parafannyhessea umbonata]MDD6602047.1 NifU family protein [Parafannyhessea umbonata]MDY4014589.1 NifU family protein [Parafannyhessea umbonata]
MAENTDQTKDQAAPAEGEAKQGVNRELLEATIDVIRQSLQADGGDVVLVNCTDDGVVTLEMQGACAGCPLSSYDMSEGIERILKEHVPGVTKVEPAMAW